jgi:ABC-type sugar transport system ATPase subunit
VDQLSVAKNIFLGRELTKVGAFGVLDEQEMQKQARDVSEELGLRMAPTQEVRFCITDRFVVMSRGRRIEEKAQQETSPEELTQLLTSRSVRNNTEE